MFHRHRWEITSQRFNLPIRGASSIEGTVQLAEMIFFGVTITAFRCTKCGILRSQMNIGDIRIDK